MNTALLFDIDNTLTPPRQPLNEEMTEVLKRLSVPFHIVAGSHLKILLGQFFEPLYQYGFRKQFDAFINLGGVHYRCDYSQGMSLEVISAFDMRGHLGDADFNFLMGVLQDTLALAEFALPPPLKILGETITYRGAMINLCPIGRTEHESPAYRANRNYFAEFDLANSYRQKMMEHLRMELERLIEERDLTIVLGGQTSFDISVSSRDKTYAVHTLLAKGTERVIFIGDALFEGGNDASIRELAESWASETVCPLETIQVESWTDTIKQLCELGFVGDLSNQEMSRLAP